MSTETSFLTYAIRHFTDYKKLGEKTFDQLDEEQMHFTPNKESNSIAVIIQHMNGNMLSRWTNFLTEDGEKEWRKRDEEFEVKSISKEEILHLWNTGWDVFLTTLNSLKEEDLSKTITIRTKPLSVTDAIVRQLAHYSYHVGQIVYLGKWLKNDQWQSLSISKGESPKYNQQLRQSNK